MAFASPGPTGAECQPEAGPLPLKRGEIGFQEGFHSLPEISQDDVAPPLLARHPADRGSISGFPSVPDVPQAPLTVSSTNPHSVSSNLSSPSITKQGGFLALLKLQNVLGGLRLITLIATFAQSICLAGTLVGWVFTIKHLSNMPSIPGGIPSSVFIHVIFGLAMLAQMIFLERRIFTLRAERYSYLHAGEMLPSYQSGGPGSAIAFAPWNRPPLPTYAAALAQSGVGTGDVEDHLIAAPPPPAYGQTRGSTLLLSGFLRESLRAQRPRSERSSLGDHDMRGDGCEELDNVERMRRLDETLAQLERPTRRT
ncbi:hypothetical protein K443DRAFT_545887 [Laccaria amethystina LaAM-08-1]|jgi:hypothetical protein|uniref:Uncharacterized protein n=1 Tax=Laccaria amethystina LaAM-08-1 TaxID=1095629 RepID=A0A0C9XK58_9AGAR|nr:hypothetical protein K443DRAFT_545887 [Laccaria amethystina LaAM-08-1]